MIGVSGGFVVGAGSDMLSVVVIGCDGVVDSSRLRVFDAFGGVFPLPPA